MESSRGSRLRICPSMGKIESEYACVDGDIIAESANRTAALPRESGCASVIDVPVSTAGFVLGVMPTRVSPDIRRLPITVSGAGRVGGIGRGEVDG